MSVVRVTDRISIGEEELEFSAIRSQGAGGQNVNKVATAMQLRFDIAASESLPADVRKRLLETSDKRISKDGVIVIKAQEHRTQARNRDAALGRLKTIIHDATIVETPRRPTRPSRTTMRRRAEDKRKRSDLKRNRGKPKLDQGM